MSLRSDYRRGFLVLVLATIIVVFFVNMNGIYTQRQRHEISRSISLNGNNGYATASDSMAVTTRRMELTSVLRTSPASIGVTTEPSKDIEKIVSTTVSTEAGHMTKSKLVIVILTDERSGSTLLGELFNKNPRAYYQFEPLVPFTRNCSVLEKERIDLLGRMLRCDFDTLNQSYRKAFNITKFSDRFSKCVRNNMCFYERNNGLTSKYASVCNKRTLPEGVVKTMLEKQPILRFSSKSKTCGLPFKLPLLSELCMEADVVVYKILRICSIASMMQLLQDSSASNIALRVIHLVRDPRAVTSSRLSLSKKQQYRETMKEDTKELCQRHRVNLQIDQSMMTGDPDVARAWRKKYLRIRYEDMARNLSIASAEIYRFLNLTMPEEVNDWILAAQPDFNQILRDFKKEAILIKEGKGDKLKHKKTPTFTQRNEESVFSKARSTEYTNSLAAKVSYV